MKKGENMKKTADDIINDITAVLIGASGEFIAEIANRVLGRNAGFDTKEITYDGDNLFTVKEEKDHYASADSVPQPKPFALKTVELKMFHNIMLPQAAIDAFSALENRLSPENLACDGECSAHQVRQRRAQIKREWKALEAKYGVKLTPVV